MEVLTELFVGFGAGSQNLQQACAQLQQLLQNPAFQRTGCWAAVPLSSSNGNAVKGAQRQGPPALTTWASRTTTSPHTNIRSPSCRRAFPCGAVGSDAGACLVPVASLIMGTGAFGGPEAELRGCGNGASRERPQQQPQQQSSLATQAGGQPSQAQQDKDRIQFRDLSGTWIKNRESSDSMEEAMNLMRLNGLVRQAVKLVRGVRIDMDQQNFTFTVFSIISWFKVKEVYPMSGEERRFRRRDLRRGGALGKVEPHGQDLQVHLQWNDPLGGHGRDHFRLISEDELHIESVINVGGQTARYLTIYNRKPDRRGRRGGQRRGADAHLAASTELGDEGAGSDHGGHHGGHGKH